jgi:hypothetical protein
LRKPAAISCNAIGISGGSVGVAAGIALRFRRPCGNRDITPAFLKSHIR